MNCEQTLIIGITGMQPLYIFISFANLRAQSEPNYRSAYMSGIQCACNFLRPTIAAMDNKRASAVLAIGIACFIEAARRACLIACNGIGMFAVPRHGGGFSGKLHPVSHNGIGCGSGQSIQQRTGSNGYSGSRTWRCCCT